MKTNLKGAQMSKDNLSKSSNEKNESLKDIKCQRKALKELK